MWLKKVQKAWMLNAKWCFYAIVQISHEGEIQNRTISKPRHSSLNIFQWKTKCVFTESHQAEQVNVVVQKCVYCSYHLFQGVPLGLAEGLLESAYERFRLLNFLLQLGDLRTRQMKMTQVIWLGRTVTFRAVHGFFTFVKNTVNTLCLCSNPWWAAEPHIIFSQQILALLNSFLVRYTTVQKFFFNVYAHQGCIYIIKNNAWCR